MTFDKAVLAVLIVLLAAPVFSQDAVLQIADTPDSVTPEQMDEWLIKAENGDWQLMKEFAAAYLYPDDCSKLKYGHRCRAMTKYPGIGKRSLLKIIDTPVDPKELPPRIPGQFYSRPAKISTISRFQEDFAWSRLKEARAKSFIKPDPNDPACKDYIKYMSLAADNGDSCAAQRASRAYATGFCVVEDMEKARYYRKLDISCPVI